MSLTPCTVHITKRPGNAVSITPSLKREFEAIQKNQTIRFGHQTARVRIRTYKQAGNHIYISSSIARKLSISGIRQCMAYMQNDELRIGPLIGVLTYANMQGPPFGSRTPFISNLMRSCAKTAYVYAFTPQSVNWQQEKVYGYLPKPGGGWIRKSMPLPDVVYNRLPSRKAEKSISINNFKERFVQRGIPLFNWSFFDKTDVYDLLDQDDMEEYVPESYEHPRPEEIRSMLEKYRFVYLKPIAGSLGIGIFRLTYHPRRGYFSRYRRNGKNVLMRFNKFHGLMRHIQRSTTQLSNYVVQQGIRLIEIDGCPIDFRFHLAKDDRNRWNVCGIGAKKAGKGSVTTHVRSGGKLMTPEFALGKVYGSEADSMLEKMKDVAIRLAEAIESNYSRLLGELGFDIGIDKNDNIWMFEANAKPGRSIFKHPSLKTQGQQSIDHLIQYCVFLSGFNDRGEQ